MSSFASFPHLQGTLDDAEPAATANGARSVDWPLVLRLLVLIVVTCACYWPALNGDFQWDDGVLVRDNQLLRSLSGLRDIWASTKPYDYFPLTYTSFWLEWPLWGSDPAGYHLVNLLLHLTGACLLWRLLAAMRVPGAWFGAFLFALHPVNVASVAWIAERKNVLSMVFYLACLLKFWESETSGDRAHPRRTYLWSLAFFVLAALSKSSVVMLPFALLLLCWWRKGTLRWRDLVRGVPFFAISFVCGVATMWFQYHRAMDPEFKDAGKLPLLVRALMSGHSAWFYFGKALVPIRLGMLYPQWKLGTSAPMDYLPALGWIVLLAALWLGRKRWGRSPFTVAAYFLVTLLPVAGLFNMSFFTYSYVSDHLVHLPLVGLVAGIAATLGAWHARGGASGSTAVVLMAATAAWYAVGTFHRADEFSSPRRLWESTRAVDPGSFAVYNSLGLDAQEQHRIKEAEADFREALRLEPRCRSAAVSLADVLRVQGKWNESANLYQAILQLEPDGQCFNNFGVVLLELDQSDQAREQFRCALKLEPTMHSAYLNLYRMENTAGHRQAAADALRGILRIDPADPTALTALAALSLEPAPGQRAPEVAGSMVYESTVLLAERACQLTGYENLQSLAVLSRALLASGRRDEAVAIGRKTSELAARRNRPALARELAAFVETASHQP